MMRATATLSSMLERGLVSYATAASAAGVGIVALAQPANAKVFYTPAHVLIGAGGVNSYSLDVNHDGVIDFAIKYNTTCDVYACYFDLSATAKYVGGGVERGASFHTCLALRRGSSIGPTKSFTHYPAAMVQVTVWSDGTFLWGNWVNVKNRYLGLRFYADRKVHFGWARLSVDVSGHAVSGILSGYAYETIPDKPIIAGNRGSTTGQGPDIASEPASLGHLALGAAGRKQQQPNRAPIH